MEGSWIDGDTDTEIEIVEVNDLIMEAATLIQECVERDFNLIHKSDIENRFK